jgi:CPA2 family monovalent cation:H+ antiporter-2
MYSRWLESLQPTGDRAELTRIIRRILMQVMVNLALVIAVFLAAPSLWMALAPALGLDA